MNNKLQAILDMYLTFGGDMTCNTSEWCDLTIDEQMTIESNL